MKRTLMHNVTVQPARHPVRRLSLLIAAGLLGVPVASHAASFELGDGGVVLNWDTTVKYSNAFRLKRPLDSYINLADGSGRNADDGDRNLAKRRSPISNRFDLFTEADIKVQNFGARISGSAWYDTVYNKSNDNTSPTTSNNFSVPYNEFTKETRNRMGRKAELLDAFVFGKFVLGSAPLTFRAGKHNLFWGESLFFANNGVAGSQGPVDVVKAQSVPNLLAKEIFLPVGQVSGQLELFSGVTLGAFYQYEWKRTVIPPAGSFFSGGDIVDEGAECFRFASGPPCGTPGATMLRGRDLQAKDSGQYGLQLKFKGFETDWGLYATNSHSKVPNVYFNVTPRPPGSVPPIAFNNYSLVYAQNIKTFGASFTKTVDIYNFAGEATMRTNAPLNSAGTLAPTVGVPFDNDKNPAYAVGKTAHINLSVVASLPQNFIARASSITAEVGWNRTLSVTKNPSAVEKLATRDATSLRVAYTPTYYQVVEGWDLDVPVGLSYGLDGRSSAISGFGGRGIGSYNLGLRATYLTVWNFTMNYTSFLGKAGNTQNSQNNASFLQAFKDRDFVSFSASTTF